MLDLHSIQGHEVSKQTPLTSLWLYVYYDEPYQFIFGHPSLQMVIRQSQRQFIYGHPSIGQF